MAANAVYPLNVSFDDKEIARANGARWNASEKKWEFREIKDMTEDKIVESYISIKETLKEKGRDVSKLDATGQIEAMIAQRAEKEAAEAAAKAAKKDEDKAKEEVSSEKECNAPTTFIPKTEVVSIVDGKLNINQDILDNIKNKIASMNKNKSELRLNNAYNFSKLIMDNAKTMVSLAKNIGEYTIHGIRGIPGIDTLSVKEVPNAVDGYNPIGYSINLYKEAEKGNSSSITACFYGEQDYVYDDNALKNRPTDIFQAIPSDSIMATVNAIEENGVKKNAFLTSYAAGVDNVIKELRQEYEKSEQAKTDTLSEEQEEEAFKG